MTNRNREFLLKVAAVAVVGLLLLDHFLIEPAIDGWKEQSNRISDLREKVERGRQLKERQDLIRKRWAEMLRSNLPSDNSAAENGAVKAISRWAADSRITVSSLTLTPQWQNRDDGCETLEYHITAEGDQSSLGRFIYEMETDPLPVNLEECELAVHDTHGSKLALTARFTFLRLVTEAKGGGR